MVGLYNNETGKYEFSDDLAKADWYLDEEFNLYIVPKAGEILGPDNAVTDILAAAYRVGKNPGLESLGLTVVPDWQRRFHPDCGYYTV